MNERSELVAWIRAEMVGPSRPLTEPTVVEFVDGQFVDAVALRSGPVAWRPALGAELQEVIYFERESPHRRYGAGLLHPEDSPRSAPTPSEAALRGADTVGVGDETEGAEEDELRSSASSEDDRNEELSGIEASDDFEVTGADLRHPASIGISLCAHLDQGGRLLVRLPQSKRFSWQAADAAPFQLNGRYEPCVRRWTDSQGNHKTSPMWRRWSAVLLDSTVAITRSELVHGKVIAKPVELLQGSPLQLRVDVFPRKSRGDDELWLLTIVLRNTTKPSQRESREAVLYQTYFEVSVTGGSIEKYPESKRRFDQLDPEEQSLALLYRESATWGIGHGCAAGWDAAPGEAVSLLYADVFPAVQLPSMTPDIKLEGTPVHLSMRGLATLSDDGRGAEWSSLEDLSSGYGAWIQRRREEAQALPRHLVSVANRHLAACDHCLDRIRAGIVLLRSDESVRRAFRMANLAMLLQQIATKQLLRRPLNWDSVRGAVATAGKHISPWAVYAGESEDRQRLGSWRAFQVAFLLMSLVGTSDESSDERRIVDLIWFPTGGGKTEAYLAVMAFYMFHSRIRMATDRDTPTRDGTNVLMRYTLRMLTTQQFQRAASLICAMEYLRRNAGRHQLSPMPGRRFSLGLWIGGDGSPNKISEARTEFSRFRREETEGNPLILTECPWCRAEIGRYEGDKPKNLPKSAWGAARIGGIADDSTEGPLLHCPDRDCEFGQENRNSWLPVEVIDERIYRYPPSLVIATADKFALISYRPEAGAIFGRRFVGGTLRQEALPPGLIVQDELHLISGPLGSMYALYEGVFERFCSIERNKTRFVPKLIASTATIRGAAEQVRALYARDDAQFFPCPGLLMGDSFFGQYARDNTESLREGRLYVGIHASDYGSVLTTQVRAFSSVLFRPWLYASDLRDPWWTLVAFYNSIRELGGAKTLFDSDIRSRLKYMFNREGFAQDNRRNLRIVEELTSRLSQPEIVRMMDRLSNPYTPSAHGETLDACLVSNIIEVGVDIDRLSLMGVVGQPKTTATYIQITGRVGRRWWERPGLILTVYNPAKSRDRSHFEQFHSYHRRLYERVEPTTATPFALSAIQRGLPGALIAWARQQRADPVQNRFAYEQAVEEGFQLLRERCEAVQSPADQARSISELERLRDELLWKWGQNPQEWHQFPPRVDGEYLILWPGQFATGLQKRHGVVAPSSMRQVDRSAELVITQGYAAVPTVANPNAAAPDRRGTA